MSRTTLLQCLAQLLERERLGLIFLIPWWLLLVAWSSNRIFWKDGGLWASHTNVWGDWALHIAMARNFALNPPSVWFSENMFYAGYAQAYPFLANLLPGLLMRASIDVVVAFTVCTVVTSSLAVIGIYGLLRRCTLSPVQSGLGLSLFLMTGGPGILKFLSDFLVSREWGIWWYPPLNYTILTHYEWWEGNFVVGMWFPQRAFLLGLALSLWSLIIWFGALNPHSTGLSRRRRLILACLAGLLAGLLPITHAHSFIVAAVVGVAAAWWFRQQWPVVLSYGLSATLLGGLLYTTFIAGKVENPHFMQLRLGWTASSLSDWLMMWWLLWGLFTPLALWGSWQVFRRNSAGLKTSTTAGWIIFAAVNLMMFQPTAWDNSKLIMWSYLLLIPATITALTWLSRWQGWLGSWLVLGALLLLSGTGGLQLWRYSHTQEGPYELLSASEKQLAEYIHHATTPTSRFLTATQHNHPVSLWAARPLLMSYPAWVSNFGFLSVQRERDIRTMFEDGEAAVPLLRKYQVEYIYIGPVERREYAVNESLAYTNRLMAEDQNTVVVKLRKPLNQ